MYKLTFVLILLTSALSFSHTENNITIDCQNGKKIETSQVDFSVDSYNSQQFRVRYLYEDQYSRGLVDLPDNMDGHSCTIVKHDLFYLTCEYSMSDELKSIKVTNVDSRGQYMVKSVMITDFKGTLFNLKTFSGRGNGCSL